MNLLSKWNTLFSMLTSLFLIASPCLNVKAQTGMGFVTAFNKNALYHTGLNTLFTWNGSVSSGYCNGIGTIQFFDANGNFSGKYIGNVSYGKNEGYGTYYEPDGRISYQGYWQNDMRNGIGAEYDNAGNILFQGRYINDELAAAPYYKSTGWELGKAVMKNLFDGGINLTTRVTKWTDKEANVYIHFNGDIINTNEYAMTLVIKDTAPFIDFINYNTNADTYLKLKLTVTAADILYKVYKSQSANEQTNN